VSCDLEGGSVNEPKLSFADQDRYVRMHKVGIYDLALVLLSMKPIQFRMYFKIIRRAWYGYGSVSNLDIHKTAGVTRNVFARHKHAVMFEFHLNGDVWINDRMAAEASKIIQKITRKVRGPLSQRTRFRVLEAYNYRCFYCGRGADVVALEVDHVFPVARGGTDDQSNLVPACEACNSGKSDRIVSALPESQRVL
jgi:CRISPR/Cas system Type II protein with McrA/HNH and RuvC-like nuclease domain